MSRVSPAVSRVVAILNLFVEHSQKSFTLTQVITSIGLSRATTHSILLGLVDAGYLYRRLDKSFILGPIVPSLASHSDVHSSPLALAGQEMRTLADELDVIASAIFLEGSEIVVRERAVSANYFGIADMTIGQRHANHHLGSVFLIPLPMAAVESQLNMTTPPMPAETRQQIAALIQDAKRIGFIGSLMSDNRPDRDNMDLFIATFRPQATYNLRFLAAPVIGSSGEPMFAIALRFHRHLTGAQAIAAGRRLCESCERVSRFLRGKAS